MTSETWHKYYLNLANPHKIIYNYILIELLSNKTCFRLFLSTNKSIHLNLVKVLLRAYSSLENIFGYVLSFKDKLLFKTSIKSPAKQEYFSYFREQNTIPPKPLKIYYF
jgi:hypothetical protein